MPSPFSLLNTNTVKGSIHPAPLQDTAEEAASQPRVSKTPPAFKFPYFPPAASSSSPSLTTSSKANPNFHHDPIKPCQLLSLPVEIRLQIYEYVLISHSIHHAHLAPVDTSKFLSFSVDNEENYFDSMLIPASITYPHHLARRTRAGTEDRSSEISSYISSISSPYEIMARAFHAGDDEKAVGNDDVLGKLPTGLLASCNQIFSECRTLPFERNMFHFTNWLSSGINAGRTFMRSLRGWQAEAVGQIGLEMFLHGSCLVPIDGSTEMQGDADEQTNLGKTETLNEWLEICELCTGVRTLRLCLKDASASPHNLLTTHQRWITHGLLRLTALRSLEITFADNGRKVDRNNQLRFCEELGDLFRSEQGVGKGRADVKIILREIVTLPKERERNIWEEGRVAYDHDPRETNYWTQFWL